MSEFKRKKEAVLKELAKPAETYSDKSPKGSVDCQIRGLVDFVNSYDGLVTTSSCSGRISVFLEGSKDTSVTTKELEIETPARNTVHSTGKTDEQASSQKRGTGKGFGGKWLFVSHEPLNHDRNNPDTLHKLFNMQESQLTLDNASVDLATTRFIHFKFEPMILHLLAADSVTAHHILVSAHQAGLRESGASSLEGERPAKVSNDLQAMKSQIPIPIAVRTTSNAFDNIIGFAAENGSQPPGIDDNYRSIVSEQYLELLVGIANHKFELNAEKMRRFQEALRMRLENAKFKEDAWEDTATRNARKREEGLRRREQVLEMKRSAHSNKVTESAEPNVEIENAG